MMIYDEEVYVSEEQQRDYNLLVKLSDSINTEISKNRNAAIEILLSEDLLASNKKAVSAKYSYASHKLTCISSI